MLLAPLASPLRAITPHGGWRAPRWDIGPTGSTGDPTHPRAAGRQPDRYHMGIDLECRRGESVLAVADGLVVDADPGRGGICVKLSLAQLGLTVVYCDLASRYVHPGARVIAGGVVGYARSFVHVAVKDSRGKWIDPRPLIPYLGQQLRVI